MMPTPRAIAVAGIVVTATMGSLVIARADATYRACIAASDGSNQSWLQCGNAFIDREKQKFEIRLEHADRGPGRPDPR